MYVPSLPSGIRSLILAPSIFSQTPSPDCVLLLPLDVTCNYLLPFSTYSTYVHPTIAADTPSVPAGKTPLTCLASAFFRCTRHVMCAYGRDGVEPHDIAAVWAAIAHPPRLERAAPRYAAADSRWNSVSCPTSRGCRPE